jgi:hypothetical protein
MISYPSAHVVDSVPIIHFFSEKSYGFVMRFCIFFVNFDSIYQQIELNLYHYAIFSTILRFLCSHDNMLL